MDSQPGVSRLSPKAVTIGLTAAVIDPGRHLAQAASITLALAAGNVSLALPG